MTLHITDFAGLLLDFDGTLVNTEDLHCQAMQEFFMKKRSLSKGKEEAGKSTVQIFKEWGEEIGNPKLAKEYLQEYIGFLCDFFTEHIQEAHWYPDAEKLIEASTHFPRAIVTGTFRFWMECLDPKLRIFEKFEHLITKEDVLPDHEKPDPLAYQLAAQKLGLAPSECLAVEDSYSGILSAKQAGCTVVAVKRNLKKGFEYAGEEKGFEHADHIVSSLTEIL